MKDDSDTAWNKAESAWKEADVQLKAAELMEKEVLMEKELRAALQDLVE